MTTFEEFKETIKLDNGEYTPESYVKLKALNSKLESTVRGYMRRGQIVSGIIFLFIFCFTTGLTVGFAERKNFNYPVVLTTIGFSAFLLFMIYAIVNVYHNDGASFTNNGKDTVAMYHATGGELFMEEKLDRALNHWGQSNLNIDKFFTISNFGGLYDCHYLVNGCEKNVILNFDEATGIVTPASS